MTVTPTVVTDLTNLTVVCHRGPDAAAEDGAAMDTSPEDGTAMDTSPENGTAVDATAEPPDTAVSLKYCC